MEVTKLKAMRRARDAEQKGEAIRHPAFAILPMARQ
jgi:hypothetical protein